MAMATQNYNEIFASATETLESPTLRWFSTLTFLSKIRILGSPAIFVEPPSSSIILNYYDVFYTVLFSASMLPLCYSQHLAENKQTDSHSYYTERSFFSAYYSAKLFQNQTKLSRSYNYHGEKVPNIRKGLLRVSPNS